MRWICSVVEHLPNMLEALFSATNIRIKKPAWWWHLDVFSELYLGAEAE